MQRFFLSKSQRDWGMKHCLPDLSEIQKANIWFFGQLHYWQIHFLSTHTGTKNFTNHISINIILKIF